MQNAKILFLILSFFLLSAAASGTNQNALYLSKTSVSELKDIYKKHQYKDYIYMPDWEYPAIFLDRLPTDFNKISNENERNKLFLMIVGPLALRLNQEILQEREQILELSKEFKKNKELTGKQESLIEEKARKYDIFTRLEGYRRYDVFLSELTMKVDAIPPSIMMAVAAIDTDWGTSAPALKANSLYKELVWNTDKGLKPDDSDDSYRFKNFPSVYSSMQSYALKLNSNINYDLFRRMRAQIRYRDKPVFGRSVAHLLVFDSPLVNIAGIIDYTITFYELTNWDEASLKNVTKN